MNTLLLALTIGQFTCAGGSCSIQDRPGLFNRMGSGLFGGAHYNSRMVAQPVNYFEAGACYGGAFAASCYAGAYPPQIVYVLPAEPVQPSPPNYSPNGSNYSPNGSPYRQNGSSYSPKGSSYSPEHTTPMVVGLHSTAARKSVVSSDARLRQLPPDLPAPELTTYGAKRPDGTMKWGVSKAEAIASWKGEKPPKSRIVSPPPTGRPGTRFASLDPTPPGDPVRRVEVVSTVAEGRPFDLDKNGSRPPPMTGIQDTGEAAGPPPKALYCPGCGGVRKGFVDQDDSETDCVVTCLHPGCSYRFSWRNSPAQWRAVMQRCPYCRANLSYTNGCVQCPKCWFQFVVNQDEFNGEFRK